MAKRPQKINIVIPMAGQGRRFMEAGYTVPKPFIDVAGKPMIERVLENLSYPNAKYTLIVRKEHLENGVTVAGRLKEKFNVEYVVLDNLTEGAACTVLYARRQINNDEPMLIANCDQILDFKLKDFIDDCFNRELDGSILTFLDSERNPKWSFARTDEHGLVKEVREKQVISDRATVGLYLFSKGRYFVDAAIDMIIHNERTNNEFYVCPVYNYMIRDNRRVGIFNIDESAMHGIGTPEDLDKFLGQQQHLLAS